ncbi:hypothetical protein DM01DRAFT_1341102, partial [Hesseltinella vesiculosa]
MMANPQCGAINGQNSDAQKSVSLMQRLASKLECTPMRNDKHGYRLAEHEVSEKNKNGYSERKYPSNFESKHTRRARGEKPYTQKSNRAHQVKSKTTVEGKRKPGWTDEQWDLYKKGHCVHCKKSWSDGHQCTEFLQKQAKVFAARAARLAPKANDLHPVKKRNEDTVMGDVVSPSALFEDLQIC